MLRCRIGVSRAGFEAEGMTGLELGVGFQNQNLNSKPPVEVGLASPGSTHIKSTKLSLYREFE